MDINEKDWKLFKSKLVGWQENYIARLNKEYIDILSQSKNASEIFWELEKRINNDKRNPGVALYCKRSNTVQNIATLINANVIDFTDLQDFSDAFQEAVKLITRNL